MEEGMDVEASVVGKDDAAGGGVPNNDEIKATDDGDKVIDDSNPSSSAIVEEVVKSSSIEEDATPTKDIDDVKDTDAEKNEMKNEVADDDDDDVEMKDNDATETTDSPTKVDDVDITTAKVERRSPVPSGSIGSKKRGRGSSVAPTVLDAVTASALTAASQYASNANWYGLSSLLSSALAPTSMKQFQQLQQDTSSLHMGGGSVIPFIIPSIEMVQSAATKACLEQPPWVHWSKSDMAPQLKVVDATSRLQLQGAMRGYRMARASHGVNASFTVSSGTTAAGSSAAAAGTTGLVAPSGTTAASNASTTPISTISCFYFEVVVLPGPKASEILKSLPQNARLGPGLREQLNKAVEWERQQLNSSSNKKHKADVASTNEDSTAEDSPPVPPKVGGHVRVGWSMRTGELQAPVGYDKWSYGIRDQGGSIIHCSQRQDLWGGVDCSEPGTVIGCSIALDSASSHTSTTNITANANNNPTSTFDPSASYNNHIRFFKNGECMGEFVVDEEGRRSGGEAYTNIELGTYYPAVSCYMGGAVKANFGPHWIYPPKRGKLPLYMKQRLQPVSAVCPAPVHPDQAVAACTATAKLFRTKVEHQNAFKEAIRTEAELQYNAYQDFLKHHIQEIRSAREERGLPTQDLPE